MSFIENLKAKKPKKTGLYPSVNKLFCLLIRPGKILLTVTNLDGMAWRSEYLTHTIYEHPIAILKEQPVVLKFWYDKLKINPKPLRGLLLLIAGG